MHHQNRKRRQHLNGKVPIGDGVQTVLGHARKAQEPGHVGPVQKVVGAGQRAGPQRHHIEPRECVLQPPLVAFEHLHVGQQVVRKKDRLGVLEVCVSGHDHIQVSSRLFQERMLEPPQPSEQGPEHIPQVHADVQRHLVVPAPAGVQLAPDRADQLREPPLDRHMNIFVLRDERKAACFDFSPHVSQASDDGGRFPVGQYIGQLQGLTVDDAALNIVLIQPLVEREGSRERLRQTVRWVPEPA